MTDMISRDEALDCINETNNQGGFTDYSAYSTLFDDIASMDSANGWISCDEKLPEHETMVIIACYGSDIVIPDYEHGETVEECMKRLQKECVKVTLGFIGSDGWYTSDYYPMMITPKYWQPLPEPPEVK